MFADPAGTRLVAEQNLRDYSTVVLDDSLREAPLDYKEVSEQEFDKLQSDAMSKSVITGIGSMFKKSVDNDNGQEGAQSPVQDTDNTPPAAAPDPARVRAESVVRFRFVMGGADC